jgi:hypothetical protein
MTLSIPYLFVNASGKKKESRRDRKILFMPLSDIHAAHCHGLFKGV